MLAMKTLKGYLRELQRVKVPLLKPSRINMKKKLKLLLTIILLKIKIPFPIKLHCLIEGIL